jgi:chemotaxis protein MotB
MARKKKHPEHVNHERWLISYADFITLLFAFFVVMFAVSQVDSKRVGRFSESFSEAVGVPSPFSAGQGLLAGVANQVPNIKEGDSDPPLPEELEKLKGSLGDRAQKGDGLAGLKVMRRRHELVLRLSDGVLFDSGNDKVRDSAVKMLRGLSEELKRRGVDVRVEGHTDNIPISTPRFRSNWELSTARATAVVQFFAGEGGMSPDRLSAAGYGEFRPVVSNSTPELRGQNRRVDLVIAMPAAPEDKAEKEEKRPAPAAPEPKDDAEKQGTRVVPTGERHAAREAR